VESGLTTLPALMLVGLSAVLIVMQQDFSTSILVLAIALFILFLSGAPMLFMMSLAILVLLYGLLLFFTSQYRVQRVVGFLMSDQHTQTLNYQIHSALRAIRSGGIWGKGIGLGTIKLNSIPEVQSDFIFAAFVEETGFVGVIVFVALWAFVLIRASITLANADYFSRLAGFGIITLLSFQILLNLGVVIGIVPTTGIALPFFSSGGSAALMTGISCGILINLCRGELSKAKENVRFSLKGEING